MNPQVYLGAVLTMRITAYCLGPDAPGPFTFSGTVPKAQWTVAADHQVLPVGARVHIGGLAPRYRVEDKGSAIVGMRLDLFMSSCELARQWGVQERDVIVMDLPEEMKERNPRTRAEVHAGWQSSESLGVGPSLARTGETTGLSYRASVATEGDDRRARVPGAARASVPSSLPSISEGRYATSEDQNDVSELSSRTAGAERRDFSADVPPLCAETESGIRDEFDRCRVTAIRSANLQTRAFALVWLLAVSSVLIRWSWRTDKRAREKQERAEHVVPGYVVRAGGR